MALVGAVAGSCAGGHDRSRTNGLRKLRFDQAAFTATPLHHLQQLAFVVVGAGHDDERKKSSASGQSRV